MLKSALIWEARSLSLKTGSHLCFNGCLLGDQAIELSLVPDVCALKELTLMG